MRPFGGEKLTALPIRLRSTCTRRSSIASTTRDCARACTSADSSSVGPSGARVAAWISASTEKIGPSATGSGVARDSSASIRLASEMSVINRSSRRTSSPMMLSRRRCWLRSSMRNRVSIAERIEDSGFLISWLTSAANRSIASIRAHSARALSSSASASSPISSRRPRSRAGTLPVRPIPSRMTWAEAARLSSGRAMVRDRYQDSSTVIASATKNSTRMEERTANSERSTSRASRVSWMMPTVCPSCATGSATVTSRR